MSKKGGSPYAPGMKARSPKPNTSMLPALKVEIFSMYESKIWLPVISAYSHLRTHSKIYTFGFKTALSKLWRQHSCSSFLPGEDSLINSQTFITPLIFQILHNAGYPLLNGLHFVNISKWSPAKTGSWALQTITSLDWHCAPSNAIRVAWVSSGTDHPWPILNLRFC